MDRLGHVAVAQSADIGTRAGVAATVELLLPKECVMRGEIGAHLASGIAAGEDTALPEHVSLDGGQLDGVDARELVDVDR